MWGPVRKMTVNLGINAILIRVLAIFLLWPLVHRTNPLSIAMARRHRRPLPALVPSP